MNDTPTLSSVLSAQRAQSLLDQSSASAPDATPRRDDLAAALSLLGQRSLEPAKLDLLRATFANPDGAIQRAALALTPSDTRRILAPPTRRTKPKKPTPHAEAGLTVSRLDALSGDAWTECAHWLAEQGGYIVEEQPLLRRDHLLAWRARSSTEQSERAIICAVRLPPGAPLLESDLRHLQTIAAHEVGARLVAITTAEATVGARLLARDIAARLLDRDELERLLATLATAFTRERARSQDSAKAQATAATAAHKKLLSALTPACDLASAAPNARRVTGRPAVKLAVEQGREARRLAAQALLAWETLTTEWLATFGERPARDGSLVFAAEPGVWVELGVRATHLKKPLVDALRALARAPGDGDLGYGAWRQAVSEELAARCQALRWRASMIDPAQWRNFEEAVNDQNAREASLADNAASHAAARAQRAQTELTERAGA